MIYCVSDIHGELDKFERLLTLTQFSENDHLYVIGDACQKGGVCSIKIAFHLYSVLQHVEGRQFFIVRT